jgi:hypothetical protein
MAIARAGLVILLTAIAAAGCGGGFGGPKSAPPGQAVDRNGYPANYRTQIAGFLLTTLKDREDFGGALIAPPALKTVGQNQHYVVCLELNGHNERKNKVLIYLDGSLQQYVEATPDLCGDAAYQPFQELAVEMPAK